MIKLIFASVLIFSATIFLSGCVDDATVASHNLSKAADNFEIRRRIVFVNGITDKYMLSVEGLCSMEFGHIRSSVTCKTGPSEYKKHYMSRSDNTFIVVEQIDGVNVSTYHYRVVFKPQTIIPDIDLKTSKSEFLRNRH